MLPVKLFWDYTMTQQAPNSLPEWENLIRHALAVWTVGANEANPFGTLSVIRERMKGGNLHTAISQLLEDALLLLEDHSPKYAQLLRLRFHDKQPVRVVAVRLSLAESSIYRIQ